MWQNFNKTYHLDKDVVEHENDYDAQKKVLQFL